MDGHEASEEVDTSEFTKSMADMLLQCYQLGLSMNHEIDKRIGHLDWEENDKGV